MDVITTDIEGLYIIEPKVLFDYRGSFCKTYNYDSFKEFDLNTDWREEYFSQSKYRVIRGMHFQSPPLDHYKLVTCVKGSVLDVVCDLRPNSITFKKVLSFELNSSNAKQIHIPKGCAHGFLSLEEDSIMFYKVSTVYSPENDSGILWNSLDFDWPVNIEIIISERDKGLINLNQFLKVNPF